MKKIISMAALLFLSASTLVHGAPSYTKYWDFEDGAVGQNHPDWDAGTVENTSPFQGLAYPNGNRLFAGDNVAAHFNLSLPTNSFIFGAEIWTDAGDINELQGCGLGYSYWNEDNEVGEAWFEGDTWTTLYFGDPWLPNPRPGTPGEWADYQWQGDSGRSLHALEGYFGGFGPPFNDIGKYYLGSPDENWNMPSVAEVELRIEYNTGGCNQDRVKLWYRSLNYDNVRAQAGEWLLLGWNGFEDTFGDFILPTNPNSGKPYEISQIKLGGSNAWSEGSFDNVYFMSGDDLTCLTDAPEPAGIALLSVGLFVLFRRQRCV